MTLFDWMKQWTKGDNQLVRGALGRMLFSGDDAKKSVKVISGGEQGRMLFGKFSLINPNILFLDEPTNHLDMESIESLNLALENFPGTQVFVSHDREFVSSLATRIIDIQPMASSTLKAVTKNICAARALWSKQKKTATYLCRRFHFN